MIIKIEPLTKPIDYYKQCVFCGGTKTTSFKLTTTFIRDIFFRKNKEQFSKLTIHKIETIINLGRDRDSIWLRCCMGCDHLVYTAANENKEQKLLTGEVKKLESGIDWLHNEFEKRRING